MMVKPSGVIEQILYWPFGSKQAFLDVHLYYHQKSRHQALVAQLTALVAWLFAILFGNEHSMPDPLLSAICVVSLLFFMVMSYISTTANLTRCYRIASLVSIAAILKTTLDAAHNPAFWIFPVATSLCVAAAPLAIGVFSYSIEALLVWSVLLYGYRETLFSGTDAVWSYIFFCTSFFIGILINHSFAMDRISVLQGVRSLERMACEDPLTGLSNRRGFGSLFHASQQARRGQALTLLMLDIDDFKMINDRFGHDVGDAVLCAVAAVLVAEARAYPCARLGGEEFGILMPADRAAACVLADTLCRSVQQVRFEGCVATVSIGIAAVHADDTLSSALKQADIALYQAKAEGKNRYVLHAPADGCIAAG